MLARMIDLKANSITEEVIKILMMEEVEVAIADTKETRVINNIKEISSRTREAILIVQDQQMRCILEV